MAVAQILKEMVHSKGITYSFISSQTGIPIDSISRSFLGKRRLTAEELILICKAIGIDINEMVARLPNSHSLQGSA